MRNNRSLITWLIILAILLGSGFLTIAWPILFGDASSGAAMPPPDSSVTHQLPVTIAGVDSITLPGWQAMLGLALLVFGAVVGAGITLAIVFWLLSRFVTSATTGPDYQEHVSNLEQKKSAELKAMNETRPTGRIADTAWQRWGVIATGMAILMFVLFLALLVGHILFPQTFVARNEALFNAILAIVLVSLVLAFAVLGFTLRKDGLTAMEANATAAIPWDSVAVIVTGLLIVGLGIGALVLLNAPA